jgi:hypothetical protein
MNRFDDFLSDYLEIYLDMKNRGIIDEIIICDETGEDYEKIVAKYGDASTGPICIYKNEKKLGAFKNKMRVVSHAKSENFIALIDSDNLVDESYFNTAKEFIIENQLRFTDYVVLSPCNTTSDFEFDFSEFADMCFDYLKIRKYSSFKKLQMLLNNGNYVMTKHVYNGLIVLDGNIAQAGPHDVIYKHLLAFQQIPKYRLFIVKNMKYVHAVHIQSFYLQEHQASLPFYYNVIIPELCGL